MPVEPVGAPSAACVDASEMQAFLKFLLLSLLRWFSPTTEYPCCDALADQVRERVTGLVRRALVEQTPGERLDQTVDALGGLQQYRPAVGAGLLLVELGVQRLVEQIREQKQSVLQCR